MAENKSRKNSNLNAGTASSSRDHIDDEDDEGWLQLSIGSHTKTRAVRLDHHQHQMFQTTAKKEDFLDLDLLPSSSVHPATSSSIPNYSHPPESEPPQQAPSSRPEMNLSRSSSSSFRQYCCFPNQELCWVFKNSTPAVPFSPGLAISCSNSRPQPPPRRPHSGLWFILKASQVQRKPPFLRQISKSYLRIKDGRMTVRLLMKYLVNKLGLESETEVEITCKGQQLVPFMTLQHIRDNLWNPRDVTPLISDPATDHIMVLHYGRSA